MFNTDENIVETLEAAWAAYEDPRTIRAVIEVSAMVSTNHVYRLELSDGSSVVAKISSYGSYFLFREDHDRLHRCRELLQRTRYANLLADILTKDGRIYTHYTGELWTVFYQDVPRRDALPRVLTEAQIVNLAEEMAEFHLACNRISRQVPLTSKSIKSDAIHLFDFLTDRHAVKRFNLEPSELDYVRRHTHEFLEALDDCRYDQWWKIPVLIDWNLGNFSVEYQPKGFRLFSRWDYDWFRMEPRVLDFYFLSRVSSQTGDRTTFSYGPNTLLEPRFKSFLAAYHRIFPLREEDVLFLGEVFRFFILNYVIREGDAFFQPDIWQRLQKEAVSYSLPAFGRLDLHPLLDALQ